MPGWIIDLFTRYGYATVFGGVFLENTGLPVPGETMLLAGAALAQYGWLSLPRVIVTAVVAAILGDNLGFLIGRCCGRSLAERYGAKIGLTRRRLDDFDRFFHRHGGRTVFIARFITGLRVFGAVLAGGSGLRWPTFLLYNAAGAVVWATAVGFAGYSLAYSWDTLERWIGRTGLIALAVVAAIAVVAALRARRTDAS
jgi:membrane protein DedA with SNARE-associated domain